MPSPSSRATLKELGEAPRRPQGVLAVRLGEPPRGHEPRPVADAGEHIPRPPPLSVTRIVLKEAEYCARNWIGKAEALGKLRNLAGK
jgi:hypothetical protein